MAGFRYQNTSVALEGERIGAAVPIDDRLLVGLLSDLESLDVDFPDEPYRWYEGMMIACIENGFTYMWKESATGILTSGGYTYIPEFISGGVDYSSRTFNFVQTTGTGVGGGFYVTGDLNTFGSPISIDAGETLNIEGGLGINTDTISDNKITIELVANFMNDELLDTSSIFYATLANLAANVTSNWNGVQPSYPNVISWLITDPTYSDVYIPWYNPVASGTAGNKWMPIKAQTIIDLFDSDNNIYNTNNRLTSNRLVGLSGRSLVWTYESVTGYDGIPSTIGSGDWIVRLGNDTGAAQGNIRFYTGGHIQTNHALFYSGTIAKGDTLDFHRLNMGFFDDDQSLISARIDREVTINFFARSGAANSYNSDASLSRAGGINGNFLWRNDGVGGSTISAGFDILFMSTNGSGSGGVVISRDVFVIGGPSGGAVTSINFAFNTKQGLQIAWNDPNYAALTSLNEAPVIFYSRPAPGNTGAFIWATGDNPTIGGGELALLNANGRWSWYNYGVGLFAAGANLSNHFELLVDADGIVKEIPYSTLNIAAISTLTYTLVLADQGKYIQLTNNVSVVFSIPTNALVAFPIGTTIILEQNDTGQVLIVPTGGVTMVSAGAANKTRLRYSVATLFKSAINTWVLSGDIIV